MRFILCALMALGFGAAVQAEIPEEIIEECNELLKETYDEMPGCLIYGAIAFHLSEIIQRDDFYGSSVKSVLDGCRNINNSTPGVWTCVNEAAKSAARTRKLIGVENMKDICYRGISDPETLVKIEGINENLNNKYAESSHMFPLSIRNSVYGFRGCPH